MSQAATVDVLIAVADDSFREFVARQLGGRARVVGAAANGSEAIAQARRRQPHVVLMDLGLLDPDAFYATRQIKAEVPGAQVVLLTADGEGYLDATGKTGADELLPKRRVRAQVLEVVLRAGADALRLAAARAVGAGTPRRPNGSG